MSQPPVAPQPAPARALLPPSLTRRQRALWARALPRLGFFCAAGALAGAVFFDSALTGLLATLVALLLFQVRNMVALRVWLDQRKQFQLPESGGIWGEVFDGLLELQRKNRKRKKRLTAMLAEFQASTAALPDGAVVLGEQGEISWFNAAARTLLALRSPQDVGIRIGNLIRHPRFSDYLSQDAFEGEVEVPAPGNRARTLALRIIPYGNQQKLLIVRDVSERHRLDAARRDFVSNASHELRTPLTVLRGYLDLMELDAQGGNGPLAPWGAPLAEMRNQALRMEALVDDMLKLARLESDRVRLREDVLDVAALAARTVQEARAVSAGRHRFELQADASLRLVGGEIELHSIMTNLLTNAVRYTPEGGAIRVAWRRHEGGACFAVTDTGIGIAPQDLPRLTERFYRVDVGRSRDSGGTGLGLSIVKHALEAFDARLEIESEVGVGSTFSCLFPTHRLRTPDDTAAARPEPVPPPAGEDA